MSRALREFGYVAKAGVQGGLDFQVIPSADFDYLKVLALRQAEPAQVLRLSVRAGSEVLQVQNYVGVLALPSGEQLEIVPKTSLNAASVAEGRRVLLKMLSTVYDLDFQEAELAGLETLRRPWIEALTRHVLVKIAGAIRGGLCKSYRRKSSEGRFLKGQLQIVLQIRQRAGKQHHFHTRHDHYSANRPENRLLKSALEQLARWTRDARSQQLCRELLFVMSEVPASANVALDLQEWSSGRETSRYAALLPWIRLILAHRAPVFAEGPDRGFALLFPMEVLFEKYVAKKLMRVIRAPFAIKAQARSESLVTHQGERWFQLKPDLLVLRRSKPVAVLDTKWKLLDSRLGNPKDKYDLAQQDFYQMLAYGHKYLGGEGEMFLIYPQHSAFTESLDSFSLSDDLRVWAVPFDMTSDAVVWPNGVDLPWQHGEILQAAI